MVNKRQTKSNDKTIHLCCVHKNIQEDKINKFCGCALVFGNVQFLL